MEAKNRCEGTQEFSRPGLQRLSKLLPCSPPLAVCSPPTPHTAEPLHVCLKPSSPSCWLFLQEGCPLLTAPEGIMLRPVLARGRASLLCFPTVGGPCLLLWTGE